MKLVRMLILALGLVTLATASSFAAVAFNTTATVNMMNMDAQTGLIGSILYTPMGVGGTVNAGEIISLNLPTNVPISYLPDITVSMTGTTTSAFAETFGTAVTGTAPNGKAWVNISGSSFAAYGDVRTATTANFSGAAVTVNQGSIVISFGSSVTFAPIDFIKIDGVRVDVTAMAQGGGYLTASLTNTLGQATTDTPQLTVATFVPENGIFTITSVTGVANTAGGAGIKFYSNGTPYDAVTGPTAGPQSKVTVTLKELFPNAWETKNTGATAPTMYTRIKMALTVPAPLTIQGVTFEGPDGATFTNGQFAVYGYGWTTPAVTNNPIEIGIVSQNANKIETCKVGITFGVTSGSLMPISVPSITVQATLDEPVAGSGYPAGTTPGLPYSNNALYNNFSNLELKYKAPASPNATATIPVAFIPMTTNLLSTFNAFMKNTDGTTSYDTGIAISNLSGTNPATPTAFPISTAGSVIATLYPYDGSPSFSVDSSTLTSTPKLLVGMDAATGTLPSKQTWKIMLSQLLKAGSWDMTKEFAGIIRFKCNFQEASGVVFVYNINYLADGNVNSFVGYQMYADTPTNLNLNLNSTTNAITGTQISPLF